MYSDGTSFGGSDAYSRLALQDRVAFHHVVELLRQTIGLAPNCFSDRALLQMIHQRQSACHLPDLAAYWMHLQISTAELTRLIEAIVVPETWFFRDYEPFVYLAQVVRQEWLPRHRYRRFRVLSVPCATGEEPYSIAIALLEAGLPADRLQVDAIDVSQIALEKAKRAVYDRNSFREKRFVERDRYFVQTSAGYQLKSAIQETVQFRQANLLDPHAFLTVASYDVIFCRNLLIYLDQAARKSAIATLNQLLTQEGVLFVGHSELSLLTAPELIRVRQPFTFALRKTLPQVKPKPKPPSSIKPVKQKALTTPLPVLTISALERAREFADRGQLQAAIGLCQTYLTETPTDPEAYVLLGTLQQAIRNNRDADRAFQQALYLDPNHEEALLHLVLLREEMGDRINAQIFRQRLQRLQRLRP